MPGTRHRSYIGLTHPERNRLPQVNHQVGVAHRDLSSLLRGPRASFSTCPVLELPSTRSDHGRQTAGKGTMTAEHTAWLGWSRSAPGTPLLCGNGWAGVYVK